MNDWLIPLLQKRSIDAMCILCDLIQAGLKNGCCSANDIRDIKFDQPNIIGGVFKILPKFGFTHTDKRIKTTAKRKHSRRVDVYVLGDWQLAFEAKEAMRNIIIGKAETVQKELF